MKPRSATVADLKSGPLVFLGLGLGAGLAAKAPGTFGTLAAIPLYYLVASAGNAVLVVVLLAVLLCGPWICAATGSQLDSHDHPAIVWDEIAGYFVTMALVPVSIANIVLGFLLFRLFDIAKPWPIKWIDQKVDGGVGIMLDDIAAGIVAAVILFAVNYWNPGNLFA